MNFILHLLSDSDNVSSKRFISILSLLLIAILSISSLFVQIQIEVLYTLAGLCCASSGLSTLYKKPNQ